MSVADIKRVLALPTPLTPPFPLFSRGAQADVVAELPHDDAVQDAVFDSDGNYLVTVADDCMVRLWS